MTFGLVTRLVTLSLSMRMRVLSAKPLGRPA